MTLLKNILGGNNAKSFYILASTLSDNKSIFTL